MGVGLHGEALQEPLTRVATGDGIRVEVARVSRPMSRSGEPHVGDRRSIEEPLVTEGGPVDVLCRSVLREHQPSGRHGGGWHRTGVVVLEQYQLLGDGEAGPVEAGGRHRGEGGGAHPPVAACRQFVEPAVEFGHLGQHRLVVEDHVRGVVVGRPRTHPDPDAPGAEFARTRPGGRRRGSVGHLRDGSVTGVSVLFATHAAYLEHLAGPRHPERPERLNAVLNGAQRAGLADALVPVEPVAATRAALELVHPAAYLDRIEGISAAGGGRLDPDTYASEGSWNAAVLAAGAGLTAVEALRRGEAASAFCAVRPPGHHATAHESMGFCFVNNVAVVAASLAEQGERVLVFDFDAHHGNGTNDIFYADPRVLFVSIHQWPLYPGTGRHDEIGTGHGRGFTLNIPVPPGATGDVYLYAFDELVAPVAERFAPTWVIVSAGFDAHRDDPITDLGLAAGDYAPLTRRVLGLVPVGRRLVMLEGGYDLDALANSSATVLREMADVEGAPIETATSGGPGMAAVSGIRAFWEQQGLL